MAAYGRIIFLLSAVGAFREFRPSESYFSPYLNGPKNFTETEINNDIYPVGTYSHMALLIAIFLLTDWLKYKPVIILQGLSGVISCAILIWCQELPWMQLSQVSNGLFAATEVAYFSYLYAKIDKQFYQKATAQTKSVLLIAKASSGLVAQVLVMIFKFHYEYLNYLTISALSIGTLFSLFLPPAEKSFYFHRNDGKLKDDALPMHDLRVKETTEENTSYSLKKIFAIWKKSMSKSETLKWSIWSTLSLCGSLQISGYIQLLWQAVINTSETDQDLYHGLSISLNSISGAVCTYAVGYWTLDWGRIGEKALAVAALLQGGLILTVACVNSGLGLHYIIYAVFKILYYVSSTIVSSEIAKSLDSDSYGLVFGANQFFALVAQSILTVLVTKLFSIDIRTQFCFYGAYFIVLGLGFFIAGMVTLRRQKN